MTRRRAFTLIELVLVLLLMAVVAAAAAPSLGGWGRGQRLGNASDELVSTVRWARMTAVGRAAPVRLQVDAEGKSYLVSELVAGEWQPVAGEQGVAHPLGDGITMTLVRGDGAEEPAIDMWPSGRISPVRVTLTADWGQTRQLACEGAAEPLRPVKVEGTTP